MQFRNFLVVFILAMAFVLGLSPVSSFASMGEASASEPPVSGTNDESGGGLFPSLSDLGDWLVHLIVPRDTFFQEEYEKIDKKLKEKLPFQTYIDTIGRLKEVSAALDGDASVLDIPFEYDGEEYKMSISDLIAPHIPKFRGIVTGLYIFFIALYNYRQIMHLIRGTNYAGINATLGNARNSAND